METKWLVFISFLAGCVGGGISNGMLHPNEVIGKQESPIPGLIEAREIRIVDGEGKTRISLGMDYNNGEGGDASIRMFDQNEGERLFLLVMDDEVGVTTRIGIANQLMIPRVDISVLSDDTAYVALRDLKMNYAASLNSKRQGPTTLTFNDNQDKVRAMLSALGLVVGDEQQRPAVMVGTSDNFSGKVILSKDGKEIWRAP